MTPITLTRFRDGRTFTDDLLSASSHARGAITAGASGYLYRGGTFIVAIEDTSGTATGAYALPVANCIHRSRDLRVLEAILYGWCLAERPEELGLQPGSDVQRLIYELQARMTLADFGEAVLRNLAEANPSICHTHDFCDANEAVMAAIESIERDSFSLERGDALWAKAAPFLRGRAPMTYFAVIGRVPGDEKDVCFEMLAEGREHAIEQFTRRAQADFTWDELESIRSTLGEDCHVSFVLQSDSPIVEVDPRPAPPFGPGEQVWWTDPDGGLSSGIYTIVGAPDSSDHDTIVVVRNASGSEAEVLLHEIRPLTADERKTL